VWTAPERNHPGPSALKRLPEYSANPGRITAFRNACMISKICYHAVMVKQLTVRGVSDELGRRLESISREKGKSVNRLILEILEGAVSMNERRERLKRYATWTQQDLHEFEEALAAQRTIDDDLWR
jgi:hypothetical protein